MGLKLLKMINPSMTLSHKPFKYKLNGLHVVTDKYQLIIYNFVRNVGTKKLKLGSL